MATVSILDSIEEHNNTSSISNLHDNTYYFVHVKKNESDVGKLQLEDPIYEVKLDRSSGKRLGLKLDVQVAGGCLFIKEVMGALAFQWNGAHHNAQLKPGDRIMRVNKVEGDANGMLAETKKRCMLEMEVQRGSGMQITAGLTFSVRKAFGHFELLQEGAVIKVDDDGDAEMRINGIGKQWVRKQDYDNFFFDDSDRYYLKRYVDFKDFCDKLKAKVDKKESKVIKTLPPFPLDARFAFASVEGSTSTPSERKEGMQQYMSDMMAQVSKMDEEPLINEFFGDHLIPEVGALKEDTLKQRMETLIATHQSLGIVKAAAENEEANPAIVFSA